MKKLPYTEALRAVKEQLIADIRELNWSLYVLAKWQFEKYLIAIIRKDLRGLKDELYMIKLNKV